MDKTLISLNIPNVISVGVIVIMVLVLYALFATYAMKWMNKGDLSAQGNF